MKPVRTLIEYLDFRLGRHVGTPPELTWFCPVCIDRRGSESNKQKLHINISKGIGHCYRCEFGFRSLEHFFRTLNNGMPTLEELRIIRREIKPVSTKAVESVNAVLKPQVAVTSSDLTAVKLPSEMVAMTKRKLSPMDGVGLRYLRSRGITDEQITRHEIGYCSTGRYAGYLIFPVRQFGSVVYFTTRYAGKVTDGRKSNNPPKADGFHAKSTCLLNYDGCVGKKSVAIVEGPFDMMAWESAVALMGKTISDRQIALIDKLAASGTEEIIVSLDSDAVSYAHAVYTRLLGRVPKVTMLVLRDGDPFDNRDKIDELAASRGVPSAVDLVSSRYRVGHLVHRPTKTRARRV